MQAPGPTVNGREALIGNSTKGVFLSRDGGTPWRGVSGLCSGLEATSKNATTLLAATTGGVFALTGGEFRSAAGDRRSWGRRC